MPVHTRNPLLLYGNFGITPTAAAVTAGTRSNTAYIGDAQNVTVTIYNGDGANNALFTFYAASNVNSAPGLNYNPGVNDWAEIFDSTTGTGATITVNHGATAAFNIPNLAAPFLSIVSSANLSACLAFCNASI